MTKLFPTRSFTIVADGRTYKFAPSVPCTAAQRRVLTQRHFTDGWVTEISLKRDPHLIRRMDGRADRHATYGSDKNRDLEYLCIEEAALFLGADKARAKRQGQVSIVNGLFAKVREHFEGHFTEMLLPGADDQACETDYNVILSSILMADSLEVANDCRSFIRELLKRS